MVGGGGPETSEGGPSCCISTCFSPFLVDSSSDVAPTLGGGSLVVTGGASTLSRAHDNTHSPVMNTFISHSTQQSPYQPTGK